MTQHLSASQKNYIERIKKERCFKIFGEPFKLRNNKKLGLKTHPILKGEYRWVAHGFRLRFGKQQKKKWGCYGAHEELAELVLHPDSPYFTQTKHEDRCKEFVKWIGLPSTATPVLYVEVHGIFSRDFDAHQTSLHSRVNNWKVMKHCHPALKDFRVQNGMLSHPSNTIQSPPRRWKSKFKAFWKPEPDEHEENELRIDVGQANGSHTYGWLKRGGHSLLLKGSNDLDFHAASVDVSQDPPQFTDLTLSRSGFLLFELQKKVGGHWIELRQDNNEHLNPLSLPIILDRSEKALIDYCKSRAWQVKNRERKDGPDRYPLRTYAWKTNHYSRDFDPSCLFAHDLEKIATKLETFVKSDDKLLVDYIPKFGASLYRGKW